MTDSPIHVFSDPVPEAEVSVTAAPRSLTLDEQNCVHALRHSFSECRRKVLAMLPEEIPRLLALENLELAERQAVEGLTMAMREGK
jgi:hypothetical protein